MHDTLSPEVQSCIELCARGHEICLRMLSTHCVEMGGKHMGPEHVRLMLDCAQICETTADFMSRASPRHGLVCALCAEICQACAVDCERVGDMDECVEICRACAESCEQLAEMQER